MNTNIKEILTKLTNGRMKKFGLSVILALLVIIAFIAFMDNRYNGKDNVALKTSPMIIGIDGTTLTPRSKELLVTIRPYAVILMGNNISTYEQTKELITDIHSLESEKGIKIKVAVDEEGGLVARFKKLEGYPKDYNGIQNANLNLDAFYIKEREHAKFLKGIGIDINFAPVSDIAYSSNSIMVSRSAGNNSKTVSDIISNIVKIQKEEGIESTLKHFPGLGRTPVDTHTDVSEINTSKEDWMKSDYIPFKKGIEDGTENIMVGHVIYSKVDPLSASISSIWIKDILKTELSYKGKVISDDLKMDGLVVPEKYSNLVTVLDGPEGKFAVKIKASLDAGNDYVIIILSENQMLKTYKIFKTFK